jgi:hypothetical protein
MLGKGESCMSKPITFNSLAEAIDAANYVQHLLNAEYQWINNRLSWLFISQTFGIMAYTVLSTSTAIRFPGHYTIMILELGLPIFGIVCCVLVGVAVFAAKRVARSLVNERTRLVHYINENCPATIPLVGAEGDIREKHWISWSGELPHVVLPWLLGVLWLLLII